VSASALPLPAGASVSSKQPALGTAGSASADVLSVQGVASMTALVVDGSASTQPVSASALPLPAGASVSSKQPALGTAGSASADVISVQGVASMTALVVDGSASTQPVSASALPLPSGASTSALQTSGNTSLSTIAGDTTSLDTKITSGSDSSISSGQQVIAYGMNGGSFHPIPVTTSGNELKVMEEHTWTTFTMFDAVTTEDGLSSTSATLDLGSDSATPGAGMSLVFYFDLSAAVLLWELKIQTSPDGVTWYDDSQDNNRLEATITSAALTLDNEFGGIFSGSRYWRFIFTNNDGSATSTNVTLKAGFYA
jgi:hypothetical protein